MERRIIVTAGAIIKDDRGRILLQKRSDYGDWGLPGGAMEPGETIEETMIREVREETGLIITEYDLYSVYSGKRMTYTYPDGNNVVFVAFIFNTKVDIDGRIENDGKTLLHKDDNNESLLLQFFELKDIDLKKINKVQKQIFEDLNSNMNKLLRN